MQPMTSDGWNLSRQPGHQPGAARGGAGARSADAPEYVCEQTKIPNPVAILVRMRVRSFDDGIADKIREAHKCQRVPISLNPAD